MTITNTTIDTTSPHEIRGLSASELDDVNGGLAPLFVAMGIGAAAGVLAGYLTAGDRLGPWLEEVIRDNT